MKKIVCSILIIMIVLSTAGCSKEKNVGGFEVKIATEMRDDGWLYYLYEEKPFDSVTETYAQYGAYNLKYKYIEGYQIPIKDSETGEVVEYAQSALPYLQITPDEKVRSELETLNNYINTFDHLKKVGNEDFEKIDLASIDKKDVIRLYNAMIDSSVENDGKYGFLPEAGIEQETLINGYQWQVGYFISYGNIKYARIDVVIDGKNYLSDLYHNGETTQEQKEIYEKILLIEKEIIEKQNFSVQIPTDETELYSLKRLNYILKKLDTPIGEE